MVGSQGGNVVGEGEELGGIEGWVASAMGEETLPMEQ